MRIHPALNAHRPVSHPIFGPTIHRPTHLIPTVFQTKKPIAAQLLERDQIKLPPHSNQRLKGQVKPKISNKLVQGILLSAAHQASGSSSNTSGSPVSPRLWPQNLRVQDDWNGRGKWGEFRPDHLEWLGVKDKHKELMLSLRAER